MNATTSQTHHPPGEPSVTSSIEHLVAGSQGVITKRIDLALLEGQQLLSRTLQRAALASAGIVLLAAAWFAAGAALVLFLLPEATPVVRLATFALLNATCAAALVALALRRSQPHAPVRQNGNGSHLRLE